MLPLAAFLVAYKFFGGIYVATATLMVGMGLSLAVLWLRARRPPAMFAASTALVVVFGAATLVLRNARFIQWKPSIFLWCWRWPSAACSCSQPLAQRMPPALGEATLPRRDWLKLNTAWVVFGLVTGAANLVLAYNVSEADWVKIKAFGLTAVMLVFVVAQTAWLYRRAHPAPAP
ncbi:MAG: septation protein IspZ [Steroidobacteraceae bacterium]